MRRVAILASASALAFLTGGCASFSFLPWVDSPDELDVVESVPGESPEETPVEEGFTDPLEEGQAQQQEVTGLLVPTQPQERIRTIEQGREDPFSIIAVNPVVTAIPQEVSPETTGPGAGRATPAPSAPTPATRPQPTQSASPSQPNRQATQPTSSSQPNRQATQPASSSQPNRQATQQQPEQRRIPGFPPENGIPSIPQPNLARGVGVSGVIQVGNVPKAIIRPSNLSHSIYVEAGEYISNGRVLVKRIEMRNRTAPIVVFEENGIEFARQVGTGGETSEEQGPTAFLPPPPSLRGL